ncbi:MAG: FlgD immunoglobulin-like domain containing protein [bacterium]
MLAHLGFILVSRRLTTTTIGLAGLLLLLSPPLANAIDPEDVRWSDAFNQPGVNSQVLATVEWNGSLYVGGRFSQAAGTPARRVAEWNGSTWAPLGDGLGEPGFSDQVNDLVVYQGTLVAAGDFETASGTPVRNIARWDGSSWTSIGTGTNGTIEKLVAYNGLLFATGTFTEAGGVPVNYIARWDGLSWGPLGAGLSFPGQESAFPSEMIMHGNELIVGGTFRGAGFAITYGLARWTGASWFPIGNWNSKQLYVTWALASHGGSLYVVASNFEVWRWDGTSWTLVPSPGDQTHSLMSYGSDLLAGGNLWPSSGDVARWDGASWTPFEGQISTPVEELGTYAGDVVAGGVFIAAGNEAAHAVARWNGTQWTGFGEGGGLDRSVRAFATYGGDLIAGGDFNYAEGSEGQYVARWDGAEWSSIGSDDLRSYVDALYAEGGDLYAGGQFMSLWGSPYNAIAHWDGTAWDDMDGGLPPPFIEDYSRVRAITRYAGGIVAGGHFYSSTMPGGQNSNIASWNGSEWNRIGGSDGLGGFDHDVRALAVYQGDLIAGGFFAEPGVGSHLARWTGTSWSALGTGVNAAVNALAVYQDKLIVGGAFTTAGGQSASYIAQWDGANWMTVGGGVNDEVFALTVHDGDLYAGGDFTQVGTQAAQRIARWDGAAWSTLGSGLTQKPTYEGGPAVYALHSHSGYLFVGGSFERAGEKPSFFIAQWNPAGTGVDDGAAVAGAPALRILDSSPNPVIEHGSIRFSVPQAGPVAITLHDASGRLVRALFRGHLDPGVHETSWGATDERGNALASGVYFARIEAGGVSSSKKVALVRGGRTP